MRRLFHSTIVLLVFAALARAQAPPDENQTIGTQMPDVVLVADDDSSFHLSTLWGKPVIVSPIFTSCPQTCGMITESLRDALREIGEPGVGYHVVTISFDPADDSAAMRAYRERMGLPDGWRLVTASAADRESFLRAIDFNVRAQNEGGFAHPNVIVVLSPDLKVSRYLHGVVFEAGDVRAALEGASKDASLITRFRPFILLVMVMGVLAVVWALHSTRRRGEKTG